MRFQVPQFIETEERIIGPFTLKQFAFVGAGGAILFLLFFVVPPGSFIFVAIPVALVFLGLALLKIEEMPVYLYLFYALNHFFSPKRYIYQPKEEKKF